jgi:hypothetical protein
MNKTPRVTRAQLLKFVEKVASLEFDPPGRHNVSQEDCATERNELIEEAMQLTGKLSACSDCGAEVPYIIGCHDGGEICQDCFDNGAH